MKGPWNLVYCEPSLRSALMEQRNRGQKCVIPSMSLDLSTAKAALHFIAVFDGAASNKWKVWERAEKSSRLAGSVKEVA